jgi:uncharacterized protein (DUF433 family)
MTHGFSAREVAELADVSVRAVDKAVEERVLSAMASGKHGRRRDLPLHAIPYTALIARLPITLSLSSKKQIAKALGKRSTESMTTDPLQIGTAVTVDVATLVGKDMAQRAERYGKAREDLIEINSEVMGGTPVIRGTRLTVYAILGRLNGGDKVADLLDDYPNLTAEAIETAALYARTHPPLGRPGGRPWTQAA